MKDLLNDASARAIRYLETLDHRPVAPPAAAVANLRAFDVPLPEKSGDPAATLRLLDEVGSPATMGMAGGRFFGFVIGGALPVTLAANWLAGAWDQNTGLYRATPGTAFLEQVALRWLLDILRLPAESTGAFVTGATVANLCALAAARHHVLKQAGWSVEADGLFGAPPITVLIGAEAHPSVTKSLGILGLGRTRIVKVPVDRQGRLVVEKLPRISGPTIVCTQAGNVNTGAFDDIGAICRLAKPAGAWVHVDGAFGLWASAAPSRATFAAGIELADSWATDAHKWLNVPYDCGLAFVKDPHALKAAMAITAEYLPTESEFRNPSDFTPELSRRARGVEVWAALHALGRAGVSEMIERNCAQARRFAAKLTQGGFEILNDVVLNQVLVSFGDAERTKRVIEAIQQDGTCWTGITVWQGRTAMRISVSSWATTDADVDRSVAAMMAAAMRTA
jgi:glutamate/tyrosine decarboxylase-like PLP-dependent enzyme